MLAIIKIVNGVKKIIPLTADAGAGNPVGTIIAMYKKSSPSGYLYLDGRDTTGTSEELSTHYPLLYAYLGSNVLPDYREFALVGAEENTTDVYNASTNPTGTIHTHDTYTEGQAKDDQLQSHAHYLRTYDNQNFVYTRSNTSVTGLKLSATSASSSTDYVAAIGMRNCRADTVTRGKRKAVYFYIKATSGLPENQQDNVINTLNEERSYSTTEHATGKKWIDGKPIYRKTINIGTLPNNTTKSVSLGIVMASLVSVQGYAHRTLDDLIIPIPFVNPSLLNQNVAVTFPLVNGVTNIRVLTASDLTVYETCYITVEYTKN